MVMVWKTLLYIESEIDPHNSKFKGYDLQNGVP